VSDANTGPRRQQPLLDREAEHRPQRLEDVLDRVLAQLALAVVLLSLLELAHEAGDCPVVTAARS
jgi:hypothetical protein